MHEGKVGILQRPTHPLHGRLEGFTAQETTITTMSCTPTCEQATSIVPFWHEGGLYADINTTGLEDVTCVLQKNTGATVTRSVGTPIDQWGVEMADYGYFLEEGGSPYTCYILNSQGQKLNVFTDANGNACSCLTFNVNHVNFEFDTNILINAPLP